MEKQMVDTGKFIPAKCDLAHFYNLWHKRMSRCLSGRYGNDAEDAVSDAFLKVFGLTETYKLEEPLKPMTEKQLFDYILQQAKWIAGHAVAKNSGFSTTTFLSSDEGGDMDEGRGGRLIERLAHVMSQIETNEDPVKSADKCRRLRRIVKYAVEQEPKFFDYAAQVECSDEFELWTEVRQMVVDLLDKAHYTYEVRQAYIHYVLNGESVVDVIRRVWGIDEDNSQYEKRKAYLYVIKKRLTMVLSAALAKVLPRYPRIGEWLANAA